MMRSEFSCPKLPLLGVWLLVALAGCGGAPGDDAQAARRNSISPEANSAAPLDEASGQEVGLSTPSTAAGGDSRGPQPAPGFPTGLTGQLVFQSDQAGRSAIYLMDLASGRISLLSGDPSWTEEKPRWSPDGSRIVFVSNRAHYEGPSPETGEPDFDLWLMNADGSGRRRLTSDGANDVDPSWTPDGRSVVFSSDRESRGDLYRLWLDSGRVDRLTRHFVGRAIMPAVSPDGKHVAFAAQTLRVGQFWDFQVHVLDLTTGRTEPVAAEAGACWPAWSPDGTRLAHVLLRPDGPSALVVRTMDAQSSERVVSDATLWSYYPAWARDGKRLAFSVSPAHHEGQDWDLAVYSVETRTIARLTSGAGNDRLPDWR